MRGMATDLRTDCVSSCAPARTAVRTRDDAFASFAEGVKLEFGPVFSGEWTGRWTSRFPLSRLFYVLETGPDPGFVADADSQIALLPGMWAILPPGREIRHCQLPGLRVVSVHFRLSMRSMPDPFRGCGLHGGFAPEWREAFLSLCGEGASGSPSRLDTLSEVQSVVWKAVSAFARAEGPTLSARIAGVRPFAGLFAAVANDLGRDFSVAEMAAAARMGESSFAKRFVATTGETPRAWFNARRAEAAAEALMKDNATVRDVAERLGFGNEFYFSRFFKRHFGLSPANWRRQRLV